ncbi:unnamed protein product [Aureobasidium vineae]|uniref:Uncharacterized protein n=1 Tax=Aureobasidium vineae TaxID=2773715 RepID=A0A9N8JZ83_9PEZI|nr:unnamed protein product [Aureobasidium vineae]
MAAPNSDPDYLYYMIYLQPVCTMDLPVEIPPYRVATFADISGSCMIHRCIGKQGTGVLTDQCKTTLSNDTRPIVRAIPKSDSYGGNGWADAKYLAKLARLCLCQDCCQTHLSDVVIAWVNELLDPDGAEDERADSVVDPEETKPLITGLAPVKSLVAGSVATRNLFSKVCGFWS